MDVKAAFFNGVLEVEIYMNQPEGFVQEVKEYLVCKLKKALYGLKHLLRVWYHHIDLIFIYRGFCRSQADHSMYVQIIEYLLVEIFYMNDLIILASNVPQLKWFKSELEKKFEMSDLG